MLRATVVILLFNMISRLLGFVRDAVIAWKFGATGTTDAYLVAYTLPYALQAVLGMSFVTVMVPALTGYLVRDEKEEGAYVTASIINGTGLILILITGVGLLVAPGLVRLLAPGFGPGELILTTRLTRIMFPSIIFMGLGLMLTGVLNAHKRFALPAFAPALVNMVIILAVLLFGTRYQVEGLAVGTLVGFIAFLFIQLPAMKGLGMRFRWVLDWQHQSVRQVAKAILPVTFAMAVNQIALAMNRFFASGLLPGSITALDFANRVMNLPLGIFAAAVATAAFPAMAEKAAQQDSTGFSRDFSRSLRLMSLTILPGAVGLLVLREPVVRLLFERGAFAPEATILTAGALFYFCLGLWFLGAIYLLTRAYYSLGDLKTPALVGVGAILSNAVFSLILLPGLGHQGLALANTLAAGVNAGLLFYLLGRRIPGWRYGSLLAPLGKMLFASLVMGGAVHWCLSFTGGSYSFMLEVLIVLALVILGAVIYGMGILILDLEEGKELAAIIKGRRMARGK